uniref:DUF1618 domain-containing protein n=1 Tax=Leersia perrieri TaxID=77586 RepID=A0A0D9XPM9_9ORYZ
MEDGDMTWTMDAMVDATELWSLDAYAGFPHSYPDNPIIMSVQDPNVICLTVMEIYRDPGRKYCVVHNTWNILFNTRSKTLLSMCCLGGQNYMCTTNDSGIGDSVQSSSYASFGVKHLSESDVASCKEIFAALEEIPELYPRDLLKARIPGQRSQHQLYRGHTSSSGGYLIRVSLCIATPPATTRLCFDFFDMKARMSVVAAHGDSVLLHLYHYERGYNGFVIDYFVYNTGSPAADPPWPPSLLLLPTYLNDKAKEAERGTTWHDGLGEKTTGLLHRAEEDDLVVASLTSMVKADDDEQKEAELLVLRSGEWSITCAPFIRADDHGRPNQPLSWRTDMAIPIGDHLLCWVDLFCGIILCDMFNQNLRMKYRNVPDWHDHRCNYGSLSSAEINTEATSRSSSGHVVRVTFSHESPPPSSSRLRFSYSPRYADNGHDKASMKLVAAHGDSVLLGLHYKKGFSEYMTDYFVYNAGDVAADPPRSPSLSMLPSHLVENSEWQKNYRDLGESTTGILRRGDDELVVANLTVKEDDVEEDDEVEEGLTVKELGGDDVDMPKEAELLVLRSGEWVSMSILISHDDGKAEEVSTWETDMVVPVGDRQLCWVDLYRGIILCDMFDENPKLRYVSLPVEAPVGKFDGRYDSRRDNPRNCLLPSRTVCVTNGGVTLKFIDIFARCCCGRRGATNCSQSTETFVINSWTLVMDDMTWVMDAMVDATELWSLDAYAGLPHTIPGYPIVSMDDPHHIFLMVREPYRYRRRRSYNDKETLWKIMVDTRSKAVLSVLSYDHSTYWWHWTPCAGQTYCPSKICGKFSSNTSTCTSTIGTMNPVVNADKLATSHVVVVCDSSQYCSKQRKVSDQVQLASPEDILAALEEIPELGCDDLLKAYSILIGDNGRRFRSLLVLPMSLRKKCPTEAAGDAAFRRRLYVPRWVLLDPKIQHKQIKKRNEGDDDSTTTNSNAAAVGDPKTEATCRNSAGHVIRVAFCHEAPPSSLHLFISISPCHDERRGPDPKVIAAHGHSVLIEMYDFQNKPNSYEYGYDYFVYTAAGDTPTSLCPRLQPQRLGESSTGLLVRRRRHDDDYDIVVANLDASEDLKPDLLVLRSGEWSITCRRIIHGKGKPTWPSQSATGPSAGSTCIAESSSATAAALRLHYVSFPGVIAPTEEFDEDHYIEDGGYYRARNPRHCLMKDRTVCVTGDTIKFVNIFPRCCCGNPAVATCDHSSRAFVINTWTLRMDDMTWVKDGIVDATEFWSKTLLSVVPYDPSQQHWVPFAGKTYIPSKIFLTISHPINSTNPAVIADIPATTTAIVGSSPRTLSHELSAMSLKGVRDGFSYGDT